MLNALALLFFLFVLAVHPVPALIALAAIGVAAWLFRTQPVAARGRDEMEARTADGRFPILNEDWQGETVLAIDDEDVPEIIRRHGARFRNPARYVIDLGNGEYVLYGADGELLDLCYLRK
jgi:hypothetical protein